MSSVCEGAWGEGGSLIPHSRQHLSYCMSVCMCVCMNNNDAYIALGSDTRDCSKMHN